MNAGKETDSKRDSPRIGDIARLLLVGVFGYISSTLIFNAFIYYGGRASVAGFSGFHKATNLFILAAVGFAPVFESSVVYAAVWLLQSRLKLGAVFTSILTAAFMTMSHGATWASLAVFPTFIMHSAIMYFARLQGQVSRGLLIIVGGHLTQNLIAIVHAKMG